MNSVSEPICDLTCKEENRLVPGVLFFCQNTDLEQHLEAFTS